MCMSLGTIRGDRSQKWMPATTREKRVVRMMKSASHLEEKLAGGWGRGREGVSRYPRLVPNSMYLKKTRNLESFPFQLAEITDPHRHSHPGIPGHWRALLRHSAFQSSDPPTKPRPPVQDHHHRPAGELSQAGLTPPRTLQSEAQHSQGDSVSQARGGSAPATLGQPKQPQGLPTNSWGSGTPE